MSPTEDQSTRELIQDSLMLKSAQEYTRELELKVARLEGELATATSLLASFQASDEQHLRELEAARVEAATARIDLGYAQRRAHHQKTEDERRLVEAKIRVAEAERGRQEAERERGAVIAALGRRSRRHLNPTTEE